MDSDSPPRKKLKQARLPFQILSHKDSSDATKSTPTRKRQLSEDSGDDVVVLKAVKTSPEFKENGTVVTSSNETDTNASESAIQSKEAVCEPTEAKVDSTDPNAHNVSPQGLTLQSQLKSNLANLFGKKRFDLTADVGRCDCGCEEADSCDEAMEEYLEHSKKGKINSKSKATTPKEKAKRKSGSNQSPKKANPSEPDAANKKQRRSRKSATKLDDSKGGSTTGKESEKQVDAIVDSQPAVKNNHPEKINILSQKAVDMFAKWRKGTALSPNKSNSELEKEDTKTSKGFRDGNEETVVEDNEPKNGVGTVALDHVANPESCDTQKTDKKNKNHVKLEAKKEIVERDLEPTVKESTEANVKEEIEAKVASVADTNNVVKDENLKQEIEDVQEKNCNNLGDKEKNGIFSQNKSSSELMASPKASIIKKDKETLISPIVIEDDKPTFPLTPTGLNKTPQRRLTPKQLERQKEVARKQEEREKIKQERENEKKRLKEEKDEQKRKEKEEKDEQKRKEREEKEELRRKDKEEKEKKKLAEQDKKNEEKKKKEFVKEEKRRKEEEKKKAEEEEERKKAKASALFTSFFVSKSAKADCEESPPPAATVRNFMPFEVKADMRMAPSVRYTLSRVQKECLDTMLKVDSSVEMSGLYLHTLKSGEVNPKSSSKTWPRDEMKDDDDDVSILGEADDTGVLIPEQKKVEILKAKFLLFHENHRPAYRGTWRKRSITVSGRRPFGQEKIMDYEVDSADEWEEEEPGESLHGSDDEKEQESEDEYEVDNNIFVPHGYLSDDEGDEENEEVLSPETQKAKLKLLGEEFEAQMKSKTSALKPVIIVLTAALQASSCSARYQKLVERRAVWKEDDGPINLSHLKNDDSSDALTALSSDPNCVTFSSGPGAKKKVISDEAIPALITLVHGNQNKRVFLTNEFSAFLGKSKAADTEDVEENSKVDLPDTRPCTPSVPARNPLVLKWPGLPPASRISISNKIKELATWGACPEEGPWQNRMCWYVPEETRVKYGLVDLKLPNTQWHYTLTPKVFSNHSNSPNAHANANATNSTDSRALITKFTKVMTPEEKQRQWESMKSAGTPSSSKQTSSKGSTGKITAFTQRSQSPASTDPNQVKSSPPHLEKKASTTGNQTSTSCQPQTKKRVQLLVSVPRGQQIASSSHCSLLSKFEGSDSKNTPSSTKVTGVSPSNATPDSNSVPNPKSEGEDCIVLD